MAGRTVRDLLTGTPTKSRATELNPFVRGLRSGRKQNDAETRKEKAAQGLQAFCLTYLAHHFPLPFGEPHAEMFEAIDAPSYSKTKGKRICRAEPRMMGKTTIISLAMPLYQLAYKKKWFILLIGESGGNAEANLATLVQEIENNELLLEDFPHLRPKAGRRGQDEKWTDTEIHLESGAIVVAKGMGARMRGMKRGHRRPDLGIVDDPESPETADSFTLRRRNMRWFGGTFMGLGGAVWDVYVIGNLIHHDGLLASLLTSDRWNSKVFKAINVPKKDKEKYPIGNTKFDGSALWPEGWSLERLAQWKLEPNVGEIGFAREMMNDPREDKERPFDSTNFTYFDFTLAMLKDYSHVVMVLDPSGGGKGKTRELRAGRRDYAALVCMGRAKVGGFLDVFHVVMMKDKPHAQMDKLIEVGKAFGIRTIGLEENYAKNLMGPTFLQKAAKKQYYPRLVEIWNKTNKVERIVALEPLTTSGIIRFARHLRDKVAVYFGQWDDFPGDHDDGPDATEMAVRIVEQTRVVGAPSGVSGSSHFKNATP